MTVILTDDDFGFIAIDATNDAVNIMRQVELTTISTQKENSDKPGSVVALDDADMRALRDWLNKEFPNA